MDKKQAVRDFGSAEEYERENDEALAALASLRFAAASYSLQASANAALILAVAELRGCGASVEDVCRLVAEAWDIEAVRLILRALRPEGRA